MAVSKILSIKDLPGEAHGKHLKAAFDYIRRAEKTQNESLVGAVNCQPDFALSQMMATKNQYGKLSGRQAYHLIISFNEGEISPDTAMEFMQKFVEEYLGENYEAVYSIHDDTEHIHGHILYNSVSFKDGRKFRYKKGDWKKEIQPLVNRLCEKYGLQTLELEDNKQKRYREWNERSDGKFVWSKMIRRDVDACILQSDTFDEFLCMMTDKGYAIKYGKHISVKLPGMDRVRRLYKLGEDYSEERIKERIASETIESCRKESVVKQPRIVGVRYRRFPKAKLTGLQKKYFARLYRLGKIKKRPYSKAWQYRADIRKMHKLQEQYLFLSKHNIHTKEEMIMVRDELLQRRQEVSNARSKVYKERYKFKELFEKYERMEELKECEECFQNGDDFFKEEHAEYEALENEIQEQGYTTDEIQNLREHFKIKIGDVNKAEKEAKRKFRLADSIVKDFAKDDGEKIIISEQVQGKEKMNQDNYQKDLEEQPPKR